MASHRQKRPFQPSITSFFGRVDRDEYEQQQATRIPSQPILEPSIQSALLSVGMRIRKAVPEGYKTHKTTLFQDTTPALRNQHTTTSQSQTRAARRAELMPFCGLHKVGGHGVQDMPVNTHEPIDMFAATRMPFTSSQESSSSCFSTDWMPAAPMLTPFLNNKRRYRDDEAEDEDVPPFQLHFSDPLDPMLAGLSFTSPTRAFYPVSHTNMPNISSMSTRAMAKPKTRRKDRSEFGARSPDNDGMDFDEAAFLAPCDDEMDLTEL